METQKPTFVQALKGGAIAGAIAALINVVWYFIAQSLGSVPPPDFLMGVVMASIFPLLIGASLFFLLTKFTGKGTMIFLVISGVFTLLSLFGTMQPTLPDGTPIPDGFVLLTMPMHLIAGGVAMWGIPKFAK